MRPAQGACIVTELAHSLEPVLPLGKVLFAFGVMLAGLRLRRPLWLSVLAGGFVLAMSFGMSPLQWAGVAAVSLVESETVFLILIMALILFFSEVLEKSGQTRRLMLAATGFLGDPRFRLAFFPALVGFLPMPGGAVFSAPLVRDMADELGLARRDTALVNYWFRHLWELCWPLYPGIILASSLAGVPLARVIAATSPCILLCALLGWAFIMRPAVAHLAGRPQGPRPPSDWRAALREGLPMLIAIGCGLGFEVGMTLLRLISPLNWASWPRWCWHCLLLVPEQGRAGFVAGVMADRELYRLVALVVSVLVFKDVLQASGAVGQLARQGAGPVRSLRSRSRCRSLWDSFPASPWPSLGPPCPSSWACCIPLIRLARSSCRIWPWRFFRLHRGDGLAAACLFVLSCQFFGTDRARPGGGFWLLARCCWPAAWAGSSCLRPLGSRGAVGDWASGQAPGHSLLPGECRSVGRWLPANWRGGLAAAPSSMP
jgi:hypothetical protein